MQHDSSTLSPAKMQRIATQLRENALSVSTDYDWCDMCTLDYLAVRFPPHTGNVYIHLPFCGRDFDVFDNYDEILTIMYGDYMQLPPAAEQVCKHTPKKVVL